MTFIMVLLYGSNNGECKCSKYSGIVPHTVRFVREISRRTWRQQCAVCCDQLLARPTMRHMLWSTGGQQCVVCCDHCRSSCDLRINAVTASQITRCTKPRPDTLTTWLACEVGLPPRRRPRRLTDRRRAWRYRRTAWSWDTVDVNAGRL